MAKQKPEIDDSLPEWDCGTYQTGSTQPPKAASGIFTVLLVAAIFLGGLISGLGLVNVRHIRQLSQQPGPTIPVSQGDYTLPADDNPIFSSDVPAPEVPDTRQVQMVTVQSPYYANNVEKLALEDSDAIYQANQPSLVEVYALSHSNATQSAVGIVLTADGYILTNAHIVEAAKRIFVYLPDGRLMPAAVVGSDNLTDMAVLYVQTNGLTPATFGTSQTLQVADPIYTVSLAQQAQEPMLMTESSMFTASRKFSTDHYELDLLQINHHSESGPLFNSFGHIVGLCISRTAQYFHENDNLSMILGTVDMQNIIDQLVDQGYVSGRPALGFQVEAVSMLFQHYWDLPGGLMVSGVTADSDAAQRGLRNGDIILALAGEDLTTREDLYTVLYSCAVGQEVIAVIFRDGKITTVTLTVTEFGL